MNGKRKPAGGAEQRRLSWAAAILFVITLIGFYLRVAIMLRSSLHIDEYITTFAARVITQKGIPLLPSGAFYEHGLLFTYVESIFLALFGFSEVVARLPGLMIGTLTIPLIFVVGRRFFSAPVGLMAALVFAFSPEAMTWGSWARMYGLWLFVTLVAIRFAFEGTVLADLPRYRRLAILCLLLAFLSQFLTIAVVPPLVVAVVVAGWLARREERPWFWQRGAIGEALALAGVGALAVVLKSIPLTHSKGPLAAQSAQTQSLAQSLLSLFRVTMRVSVGEGGLGQLMWFLTPTDYLLVGLMLIGLALALYRLIAGKGTNRDLVVLGLNVWWWGLSLELTWVLDMEIRRPRYAFVLLPVLFILAAQGVVDVLETVGRLLRRPAAWRWAQVAAVGLAVAWVAYAKLPPAAEALAYRGVGLDAAFRYVKEHRQPGDVIVTAFSAPCSLYLGRCDYYTVQKRPYLVEKEQGAVDFYAGMPFLDSVQQLGDVLSTHRRVWFVVDQRSFQYRYEPYFSWYVLRQMDLVYEHNAALVFLSSSDLVPSTPTIPHPIDLGGQIRVLGYDLPEAPVQPGQNVGLVLYWQAQKPVDDDYTIFVHLRDGEGRTVAQSDHRPFDCYAFPAEETAQLGWLRDPYWVFDDTLHRTSRWRVGETMIEACQFAVPPDVPPGRYWFHIGMYSLQTMQRLPVVGDASGENAFVLGPITVTK